MNENRKAAYRHLLYVAMIDIRNECQSRGQFSFNPFVWFQQYKQSRISGARADWLHNLADCSAKNFKSFDEDIFWQGALSIKRQNPEYDFIKYKEMFNQYLEGHKWP